MARQGWVCGGGGWDDARSRGGPPDLPRLKKQHQSVHLVLLCIISTVRTLDKYSKIFTKHTQKETRATCLDCHIVNLLHVCRQVVSVDEFAYV